MKKGMYQNLRIFFKMIQGIFYVEKKLFVLRKKDLIFFSQIQLFFYEDLVSTIWDEKVSFFNKIFIL